MAKISQGTHRKLFPKLVVMGVLSLIVGTGCGQEPRPTSVAPPAEPVVPPDPPPAAPAPFVEVEGESQAAIATQIRQQAAAMGWCPETPTTTLQVYRRESHYVALRRCQMAAYQGSYEVLAGDGTDFQRLTATVLDENQTESTATELSGLLALDRQAGVLQAWNKSRGAGDCGSLATYRLVGEGTNTQLVLQTFQAKWECDGEFTPPSSYPQRYPANSTN